MFQHNDRGSRSRTSRRQYLLGIAATASTLVSGCLGEDDEELPGTGPDGNTQSREIVVTYDEAVTARNDAVAARDEGISAFNEEAYTDAIDAIETALSNFVSAEDCFAEAVDLATEIDANEAVDLCETAVDETALQADATDAALSAARAAHDGADADIINGHIERFRSLREDAAAIDIADADAVASALGLA
ncbi:hypothetical protein HPS36_03700 [Halorubrum salinarum]|uniref:Uncharacterized protein n=1 Tax=Halorubrum salinarum TaxID=2739057 RepID=A0A7D4C4Q5_9EURY|nr:hypothetical protein [Halorubrum salinarum]QKG91998.1 hypothetical protein HPS36_03700 [Halorubrum salinarum]